MGMYIEVPVSFDKAKQIKEIYGAKEVSPAPPSTLDGTLVCVVSNPFFDAAGICYDDREFQVFTDPDDTRPKKWLVMDTELARGACPKYAAWLDRQG